MVFCKIEENADGRLAIENLENKTDNNAKNIEIVFKYFDELTNANSESKVRKRIWYKRSEK